jgi:outer membrane protein insertion porin family
VVPIEEELEQDQITIVNYLQNKGYADAKVNIHINESPKKDKIIIEINADRGPIYHFGRVTLTGKRDSHR